MFDEIVNTILNIIFILIICAAVILGGWLVVTGEFVTNTDSNHLVSYPCDSKDYGCAFYDIEHGVTYPNIGILIGDNYIQYSNVTNLNDRSAKPHWVEFEYNNTIHRIYGSVVMLEINSTIDVHALRRISAYKDGFENGYLVANSTEYNKTIAKIDGYVQDASTP